MSSTVSEGTDDFPLDDDGTTSESLAAIDHHVARTRSMGSPRDILNLLSRFRRMLQSPEIPRLPLPLIYANRLRAGFTIV